MSFTKYYKDPNEKLDYTIDWSDFLDLDTITVSLWLVPTDLTQTNSTFSGNTATVWIEGGTAGSVHRVTNRITTAAGRIADRSIFLQIDTK